MGGDARRRTAQRVGYKRAKIELDVDELIAQRDGLKERLEQTESALRCWIEAAQDLDAKYETSKERISQLEGELNTTRSQLEPALRVCAMLERQLQATFNLDAAAQQLTLAVAAQRATGDDL